MIDDEQTRLTDEHQPPSKWNPDRLAREAEVARGTFYAWLAPSAIGGVGMTAETSVCNC